MARNHDLNYLRLRLQAITLRIGSAARTRRGRIRLGAIGLTIAFAVWLFTATLVTASTWRSVDAMSNPSLTTLGRLVDGDSLTDARSDVRRARHILFPVTLPGRALGWVPWLGNELRAPEKILLRAERDIEAAELLLGGLLDAVGDIRQAQTAIESGDLRSSAESMRLAAELIEPAVRRSVEMLPNDDGPGYWFPISARLQNRVQRVESILRPTASATASAAALLRHAANALDAAGDLGIAGDETDSAGSSLGAAGRLADSLLSAFDALGSTASDLQMATDALGQDNDSVRTINEFLELTEVLALAGERTTEYVQLFLNCDGGLLQADCHLDQLLGSMLGPEGTLTVAAEVSTMASDELLDEFERARLPGTDTLRAVVDRAGSAVARANDVVATMHALLGAGGESNLLILGVSPDELRPAGGFVSSAWSAQFEHGGLSDLSYIDVVEFDREIGAGEIDIAPDSLSRHMSAGGLYLRDVTWFPHVPEVGERALRIAEASGRGRHEHVMVMTLWFIAKLTDGIGGIMIDGELLAGDEIQRVIEDGTDAGGRGFLAQLLPSLLDRLSEPGSRDNPAALVSLMRSATSEKDAIFYSSDEAVQASIVRAGWGGALPVGSGDRVAIFDSNIGWNKSDRHVQRQFEYQVVLDPEGGSTARLALSYSMPELPDYLCTEQAEVMTGVTYDKLSARCNWNLVRSYVALGARLTSHTAMPALAGSVAVENGTLRVGDDTFRAEIDENGNHYSGVVRVEAGTVSRVEFEYELPEFVMTESPVGEFEYSLRLVAQPGARGRSGHITIQVPDSAIVINSSAGQVSGNVITVSLDLLSDTEITVRFLTR